ncbi:hypothetical protein SUDANB120_05662 [Streptomyces sp. enrichment culture]
MAARFDPRGKVNRALLVGVPEYAFKQPKHPAGVSGDLPAVAHNLTELERVLRAGGVFGPEGVTVSRPRNVDEFDRELYTAAAEAEGLLLLYFSGHGAVPSTGDGLWLQMRRATIVPGAESVFLGAAPWKGVLAVLSGARAEQVVVVLDCCYAGNAAAAWDALGTTQRRRTSLLMSVQANNRIDAGDDDTPTPFTARLVELLERGLRGRGGEVTFAGLADRLRAYMSAHHTTLREPPEPWEPQSRPATSGDDVLLAVAARRPPRLPVTPPTGGPTGPGTPGATPGSGVAAGPDGAGGPGGTTGSGSLAGPDGPGDPGVAAGHGGAGDTDAVGGPGETGSAGGVGGSAGAGSSGGRDGAGDPGSTAGVGGSAGSHATSPDTTGGPDGAIASPGRTHGVGGRVGRNGPNTSGAAGGGNGPGAPGVGRDHGTVGEGGGSGLPDGDSGSGAGSGGRGSGTPVGSGSGAVGRGIGSGASGGSSSGATNGASRPGTPGGGNGSGAAGGGSNSGGAGTDNASGKTGHGNGSGAAGGGRNSGTPGGRTDSGAVGGEGAAGRPGGGNGSGTNGGSSGSGATGDGNGSAAAGDGNGSGTSGDGNGADANGGGGGSGGSSGRKGSGRRAAGWAFDPRRITTLVGVPAAALSLIVAGLTYFGGADRPPCRPPLELRLLTDPDLEPTVRKAAEAYLSSAGNRTAEGCRRSGITVYSAGSAAVVTAFGRQSGHWLRPAGEEDNPQRDIGPQPDVWIPASPASVERARPAADESAYADLTADPAPFAYSPVVLAVPQNLSGEALADRTGRLAALTAALRQRDPKAEVRRTDPEHTDAGLLATVGLHGPAQDDPATAERAVSQAGLPARTGVDLLCTLPDDDAVDERTAALVPEFLLRTGVGCDSTTRARRMAAYPVDVPGIGPTFVRVRWLGADGDTDQRDDAVRRFHAWLTGNAPGAGKGGLAVFGEDGFRSAAAGHLPLGADGAGKGGDTDDKAAFSAFGALKDPGALAGPASPAAMAAALKGYREANGPGRVLFLLDSSGSMGALWTGAGGAPGIISQSLAGLGERDDYGVWAVASDPRTGRHHTELLPFGRHPQRADAQRAVAAAPVLDLEADPYRALTAALDEMDRRGTDDHRPQLVVFLTDGEDNGRLAESGRLDTLLQSARAKGVPVVMAALDAGGCDPGKPAAAVAEASGGRCLDTKGDLVTRLREEVARTGTGDEA